MGDDELEALRKRKLAGLQNQAAAEQERAAMANEQENAKQNVLRVILEPEARERLTRIRLARPEVADAVENQLVVLYQQGRVRNKITDDVLREFVARVAPKSRDIKIERR
ncbi:MAG: DNA-binding protein [Thermoplasmatota archaeon]